MGVVQSDIMDNCRNLYVYLPPSYHTSLGRKYPVLYLHDGQNVFGGEGSYAGVGWELHSTMDRLVMESRLQEIILVGIANQGVQRLSEYAHVDGEYEGKPVKSRGKQYESFLLKEVKPFIDTNFQTLPSAENTGLMGSSMGWLVTFHMGLRNPYVFGKLGVVSPSFWWGKEETLSLINVSADNLKNTRMWLDMGTEEGELANEFDEVTHHLFSHVDIDRRNVSVYWIPGGIHTEKAWQDRAHLPLLHMFEKIS